MAELVQNQFENFFPSPTEAEKKIPTFLEAGKVVQKLLDYLNEKKMKSQSNAIKAVFQKVKILHKNREP